MKILFYSFTILMIVLQTVDLQGQEKTSQELYEEGVAAYENGDYQSALNLFVGAIEASEASEESTATYNYLGKSYYALHKEESHCK